MNAVVPELPWLWAGLGAYTLAFLVSVAGVRRLQMAPAGTMVDSQHEKVVLGMILTGVVLITISLWVRWVRIGHGPFVNLFELLISQLFSLGLIYAWAYWRFPIIRPSCVIVVPMMGILGLWVLMIEPTAVPLPPTYYNPWLWAHIGTGKIFLSLCLVGTGIAGLILLRGMPVFAPYFQNLPSDRDLDHLAWRFMVVALIFHSLMLVSGAVWAQDAWGRYWAWDALETSAFLTWLALAGAIHARLAYRIPIRVTSVFIVLVFVLAFATYFSTPFVSEAAHKGVI